MSSSSPAPSQTQTRNKAFTGVKPSVALKSTLPKRSRTSKKKVVPPEEKKNNKGWAKGMREEFLCRRLHGLLAARENGTMAAAAELKDIENEFWFHFQYPLADFTDPASMKPYTAGTILHPPEHYSEEEKEKWEIQRKEKIKVSLASTA